MKLPYFDDNPELNALRNAMGASLRDYTPPPPSDTLTIEEIERLSGEGIEIPLDEVRVLNDGTHIYKGRRVIVYIRDVAEYGGRTSMPKYHLAMCSTLSMMMEAGRFKTRYVVATRDDGRFSIQRIRGDIAIKSDEQLNVCQQCLDELNYKSFSMRRTVDWRREAVQGFSIKAFFDEFGKSCVWAMPKFDAINAPTNVYSPHFYRIAKALKEKRGYRCEQAGCGINLAEPGSRRFLHAHHLNADKSDNHPTNIRLLCIRCHANEFQHSHVRENPDYAAFFRRFPKTESTASPPKP
ncbi:HNH endonuclease [Bradyrhizobium hipponense]|uniref:HNH endonuclease n=1 Tax=Bradyrhizobium hipponense TaxID=2605638 RepID=A0A5S4YAI2_9BRAD|nr:HNH endonuclease signature motif containing protein [Bradyrhizobium hipponense]TYO61028.1 HNH endonuclease [Bradyrhizobium hipponense]